MTRKIGNWSKNLRFNRQCTVFRKAGTKEGRRTVTRDRTLKLDFPEKLYSLMHFLYNFNLKKFNKTRQQLQKLRYLCYT